MAENLFLTSLILLGLGALAASDDKETIGGLLIAAAIACLLGGIWYN